MITEEEIELVTNLLGHLHVPVDIEKFLLFMNLWGHKMEDDHLEDILQELHGLGCVANQNNQWCLQ